MSFGLSGGRADAAREHTPQETADAPQSEAPILDFDEYLKAPSQYEGAIVRAVGRECGNFSAEEHDYVVFDNQCAGYDFFLVEAGAATPYVTRDGVYTVVGRVVGCRLYISDTKALLMPVIEPLGISAVRD